MKIEAEQMMPPYEVTARNYAAAHANKIHSDAGAAEHGFAGALVPGVAMYAFLTRPVMDFFGPDWLARGAMSAKLIHPIYDGERVRAEAKATSTNPLTLELQLLNPAGKVCAVGGAGMPDVLPTIDPRYYPVRPLPNENGRWPATIAAIQPGDLFGSLDFVLDLQWDMAQFLDDVRDDSPLYRGADAVCHPAFWIAQANEIFMRNIELGMWIHTSSETQHLAQARNGERLSLRGRVADTFERRGHEIIAADLAILGEDDRVIARIKHTAIIRLQESVPMTSSVPRP